MKLHTEIEIDAPAARAWALVAERFGDVGEWTSAVHASHLLGPLEVGVVRVCETPRIGPIPAGEFRERLVLLDREQMRFAYEVTDGALPWFLSSARNDWAVIPRGERCLVTSDAALRLKPLAFWMRPLVVPMMRGQIRNVFEELAHHVEHGVPHPRVRDAHHAAPAV